MFDYKDKTTNLSNFKRLMFDKSLSMFQYDNLPETLPQLELEKILQTYGYAFITDKYKGDLYAFRGALSGQEQDPYGRPTLITIAEPMFNGTFEIGKDGILITNDDMNLGLTFLYEKYGTMLNETDITIIMANFNERMQKLLSANDDNTIASAKDYITGIINGDIDVVASSKLFDSFQVDGSTQGTSTNVSDLVELQQYIKANLYNEIGLNANYNMKRERLTAGEVDMNTDNLRPFVDNMLHARQIAIIKLNELYGLDLSVDFSSIWQLKHDEDNAEDPDDVENPDEPDSDEEPESDSDSYEEPESDSDSDEEPDSDSDEEDKKNQGDDE